MHVGGEDVLATPKLVVEPGSTVSAMFDGLARGEVVVEAIDVHLLSEKKAEVFRIQSFELISGGRSLRFDVVHGRHPTGSRIMHVHQKRGNRSFERGETFYSFGNSVTQVRMAELLIAELMF
jgi:hypothetical protein